MTHAARLTIQSRDDPRHNADACGNRTEEMIETNSSGHTHIMAVKPGNLFKSCVRHARPTHFSSPIDQLRAAAAGNPINDRFIPSSAKPCKCSTHERNHTHDMLGSSDSGCSHGSMADMKRNTCK